MLSVDLHGAAARVVPDQVSTDIAPVQAETRASAPNSQEEL